MQSGASRCGEEWGVGYVGTGAAFMFGNVCARSAVVSGRDGGDYSVFGGRFDGEVVAGKEAWACNGTTAKSRRRETSFFLLRHLILVFIGYQNLNVQYFGLCRQLPTC